MMLMMPPRRLFPFVLPASLLLLVGLFFLNGPLYDSLCRVGSRLGGIFFSSSDTTPKWPGPSTPSSSSPASSSSASNGDALDGYRDVVSLSTANKEYFRIDFKSYYAINPNILPHPTLKDTYIIVAQQQRSSIKNTVWFAELVCNAVFQNDTLACVEPPLLLPIAATAGDKCTGELGYFSFNVGPHDARVFYGPQTPYAIYGSNSAYTCFGQWIQDFRLLVDWGLEMFEQEAFRLPTEIQRPLPYAPVEKNWFAFWAKDGTMYVHYDIAPKRVFARLGYDGSIEQDLAPLAAASDEKCLAKFLPPIVAEGDSLHQATNSLQITLCKRSDSSCKPNDLNTFIFTIFHKKSFNNLVYAYEPYVMVFQQRAPFELYSISQKPIWIHGRRQPWEERMIDNLHSPFKDAAGSSRVNMLYVTSISWAAKGQKYHGYIDDRLFISFGIEDAATAAIDIEAGQLFLDLGYCADA